MGDVEGVQFMLVGMSGDSASTSTSTSTSTSSSTEAPIDSSNVGYKLLKKHGWKEGTGLGISEQGRLEPVQAYLKKNKQGLGAETVKKKPRHSNFFENAASDGKTDKVSSGKKAKTISKRTKKMQEFEKRLQEKEFERAFFREFWPDNVDQAAASKLGACFVMQTKYEGDSTSATLAK